MPQNANRNSIIAATILGTAVVAAAVIVSAAINKTTTQLNGIKLALADAGGAVQRVAQVQPAPAASPASARPDPNRRYTVNSSKAPTKGPATAKVTLVEFSDFQ